MDDERPYYEFAMPRSRDEMTKLLNGLKDTIREHIIKLVVYSKYRPKDIHNWLLSLNKHLDKLNVYNKGKGRLNRTKQQLMDELKDEYDDRAIFLALVRFSAEGYLEVKYEPEFSKKCLQLLETYVDQIVSKELRLLNRSDLPPM